MKFQFNDGGRREAGYKGYTGDCVCRAICIAANLPYQQIYEALAEGNAAQRATKKRHRFGNKNGLKSAAHGINTTRKWFKEYMKSLGFKWIPTMLVGQGCKVHLHDGELPLGRLVVAVSKHYTAVIDGVVNDTYNPQRDVHEMGYKDGEKYTAIRRRCVYGYYILSESIS